MSKRLAFGCWTEFNELEECSEFCSFNNDYFLLNVVPAISYTRDGKFPSLSEDEFVIEASDIRFVDAMSAYDLLDLHYKKLLDKDTGQSISEQNLANGKVYQYHGKNKTRKAIVRIITDSNSKEELLLKCQGNLSLDFQEAIAIIDRQYIEVRMN